MSNRAKDEVITMKGDIETILKEHVTSSNKTPDEWCVKCGEWPCPPVCVALRLKKVLELFEKFRPCLEVLESVLDESHKEKDNKKLSYDYDHTCNEGYQGWYNEEFNKKPCEACCIIK